MTARTPQYCLFKPRNLAYVTLDGKRLYLGPHGSLESRRRYEELIVEWRARHRQVEPAEDEPRVGDLMLSYLQWVAREYSASTISNTKQAVGYMRPIFAHTPMSRFGATEMRVYRQALVDRDLARTTINKHLTVIRGMFKWGIGEGLVPASCGVVLSAVPGIKPGRSGARETAPILPVDDDVVDRTLPHLHPTVAAMVRVQRLTGCRPQDVRQMMMRGLDTSGGPGAVWIYRPTKHKSRYTGRARVIGIGPKAQAILKPFLRRDPDAPLFTMGRARRSGFTRDQYNKAILRGCRRSIPVVVLDPARWFAEHRWSPNQLRHTAATQVRSAFGLEAAQVVLGHAKADVTQVYAERDLGLLKKVAAAVG